jgi:serine/threonine protein kinase
MADDNFDKTVVLGNDDKTVVLGGEDKTIVLGNDDKTVVLGGEDKTVVLGNDDKTVVLGGDDKTVVLGGGDKTVVLGGSKTSDNPDATLMGISDGGSLERTMRPEKIASQNTMGSPSVNAFNLKGVDYEEVRCLSDNSGEAQVYLVKNDGKEYVLKLYYPNFDINRKLLQLVRSFQFEMIVDLQDYGRTYVDGKNRYYELMEYLRGGTLKDIRINGDFNRFRRLTLQAAAALAYCHKNHLLHKDVKPTNYFFRDEAQQELVLGDFGISSIQETEGKSFRTTQARTPIYAAPEMYTDVIDGVVEITYAADFYSLGMTLFTLWLGESPMSSNERTMMKQKNEGRLPRLNELPEKVKQLIQGLTSVNQNTRWGYDEVERWFLGEDVAVDLSSPFLRYQSFVVDPERNLIAENVKELVPMLIANEQLAIHYFYSGRIVQWLEQSGNIKLATLIKDILNNRYPNDQKAGYIASCFAMEPTLKYINVENTECAEISDIVMSLLANEEKYAILLLNPNDPLFLWLEAKGIGNVSRMRTYFQPDIDGKNSVMRMVYELDKNIPFISYLPSSTVQEIVHAFGYEKVREEDWHALCDGRLLSWLYSHADMAVCEAVRLLTQNQQYSKALAYKVLYKIEPEAAYDLKEADTPEKIGTLLAYELVKMQRMPENEINEQLAEFIDPNDRFHFYAKQKGWKRLISEAIRCFDLNSEENRERLSAYDLRTALYRFCKILGGKPVYFLPNGITLYDAKNADVKKYPQIRMEIRNGSFMQWMSVFYHENPAQTFEEEYSYERELEKWVYKLGELDSQSVYYRRYTKALEETKMRVNDVRSEWQSARYRDAFFRFGFYGLTGLWVILVLAIGLDDRSYIFKHYISCIIAPLGIMSGIIVATRAYFRGYGALVSLLFGGFGLITAFAPFYSLRFVNSQIPGLFHVAVLLFTAIYVFVAKLTDFSRDEKTDAKFINETLKKEDIKSSLLEPLYYTFKTKSQRYKASYFGVLDEIDDQIHSISGESTIHYALWSLLVIVMIVDLCLLSFHVFG